MIYYTSDLHFGCKNKFEGRNLDTDKSIIRNWNNRVTNGDTVYILGDIGKEGTKGRKDCPEAKAYNVGCMNWNYFPITLKEILERNRL